MGKIHLNLGFAIIALLGLTACGSGGSDSNHPQPNNPPTGLSIALQEASFFGGGTVDGISVNITTNEAGKLIAEVRIDNAADLKGMFFELHYDAASWHPVVAVPTDLLAPTDSLLHLAVLGDPGVVHFGEAMLNPDTVTGFSGSGVVARVDFAAGAFVTPSMVKISSATPNPQSRLLWWSADTLCWDYINPGDYDLNGEVNLSDIVPIVLHYGEGTSGLSTPRHIKVIDGDGNNEINLADLTVIAQHYSNSQISGYDLFSCVNENDLPENNGGENGSGAVFEEHIPYSEMLPEDPSDYLPGDQTNAPSHLFPDFLGELTTVSHEKHYWIRQASDLGLGKAASLAASYSEFYPFPSMAVEPDIVFNSQQHVLTIYYDNPGDVDQDSVIGVNDAFVLLSIYPEYHNSSTPFELNSIWHLLDLDNNNQVNTADIQAWLWQNYHGVAGFRVFAANNLEDFTMIADLPFASALGNPETERLHFQVDVSGLDWDYYQTVAYSYAGEAGGYSEIIYAGE